MLEKSIISPGAPRKPSMDFLRLREEALDVVRKLAGDAEQGWTDHNLHDPGITILEQLCYALTDLGYRLNFSVPELLADAMQAGQGGGLGWKPGLSQVDRPTLPGMPSREDVLPGAPTTIIDWRKTLLDIDGMRSVAMIPVANPSPELYFNPQINELVARRVPDPSLKKIDIKGLYEIQIDAEEGRFDQTRRQVEEVFQRQRPAGEDLHAISQLQPGLVMISADIDLEIGVRVEEVLAEAFLRIDQYISPQAHFYDTASLTAEGWDNDRIWDGPRLQGGILKEEEIANSSPKKVLYLSRVIEQVYSVPGISEVRSLKLVGKLAQMSVADGVNYWVPLVAEGFVPRLDPDPSMLSVRVDGVVVKIDPQLVQMRFRALRDALIARADGAVHDFLKLPRDRQVASYQSVQHQFPDNYGINGRGLVRDASLPRMAQAHQLKTWLLFMEQCLSNYFAKAGSLGRLFQFAADESSGYPIGSLQDVPKVAESFLPPSPANPADEEEAAIKVLRLLERLLTHLLARFGQELRYFPNASTPTLTPREKLELHVSKMLSLFRDMPVSSRDRGIGIAMLGASSGILQPGGLKVRIARMLGLSPDEPVLVSHPVLGDTYTKTDFLMIEHSLLRPMSMEYAQDAMLFRFRNGFIHKILRMRKVNDHQFYRFKCYASGVHVLKPGDEIEIIFEVNHFKDNFFVDEVDEESFTFVVSAELAEKGNPQTGSWNKISHEASVVSADPWSLQVSYCFNAGDPRFRESYHRELAAQILRQETPAHLMIHIQWLSAVEMQTLCQNYYAWRMAYDGYLLSRIDNPHIRARHIALRHYRNILLRTVVPGQTDPILDLEVLPVSATDVTWAVDPDRMISGALKTSKIKDLYFDLPEVQPGITYTCVKPDTLGNWSKWTEVNAVITPQGNGLQVQLPQALLATGTQQFGILAADPRQQIEKLLLTKIEIVLST